VKIEKKREKKIEKKVKGPRGTILVQPEKEPTAQHGDAPELVTSSYLFHHDATDVAGPDSSPKSGANLTPLPRNALI
jgi:hypothetical protein